jgi:hypothetical protein
MPVVINEFEVIPESRPTSPVATATPSNESPALPKLTPREIERLMRQQMERLARVWAH